MAEVTCVVLPNSILKDMAMSRFVRSIFSTETLAYVLQFGAPTQTKNKKMISNEGKMEKSFLNFKVRFLLASHTVSKLMIHLKAANPDWNPSDPSGSLYLSRMADFGIATHMHAFGRRRAAANLDATVHFASETKGEGSITDKAQAYDRALRQSQYAATRRRGPGGSAMGMSALGPGPSSSSIFGGYSTAQTAVLGDSQGSVHKSQSPPPAARNSGMETSIPAEELELDGGLGESYVDGGKRSKPYGDGDADEEDGLMDGGVLGLLAQIYGRKDGAAGVL